VVPPATLVAFTDGLVERRYEILDTGLKRLEKALTSNNDYPLEDLLSHVLDDLDGHTSEDDIAILGLRWKQ
jgi:serine phosphatase RsbU (regulator of sigma subunit)